MRHITEETRNQIVILDGHGRPIGTGDKMDVHRYGLLHRAVSIVLFQKEDPNKILLQQRARTKYHSPLLWANSCCSHPFENESPLYAAHRRVQEELAICIPFGELRPVGEYRYYAPVGELIEHEITHVSIGFLSKYQHFPLVPEEVERVEWVNARQLPDGRDYAPWLQGVLDLALRHRDRVMRELSPTPAYTESETAKAL